MAGSMCAVHDCISYKLKHLSKSFFRFPKNKELCRQWVIKVKRANLDALFENEGPEKLYRSYVICSDHFSEEDYNNPKNKSQGLKKDRVPSLNMGSFKINKRETREKSTVDSDYETTNSNEIIRQDLRIDSLTIREGEVEGIMLRKLFKYDKGKIKEALKDIDNGMSVKSAAKKYEIPRTTLMRHNENRNEILKIGRKTVLNPQQEKLLADWVINMTKAGFPVSKETFLANVARFKKSLNINLEMSRNWYGGFMKRHKNLSLLAYQNLSKSRSGVLIPSIHNWFEEVEDYLKSIDQFHILEDPRRVFNADESAFYLNPKSGKVLAERGSQFVYLSNSNDEKENVTVLINGNAMGEFAPPMAVFRYKRMPEQLASSLPDTWTIGKSENGWMTQETMYEYTANYFHPWLVKNNIQLPIIFFLDGHVSHLSLDLSEFCSTNGIILVALYPNATHLIQPMDVAVFKGLKILWKNKVQEWRTNNDFREMKKHEFCPLLQQALQDFNNKSLINGFRKCGLVPWNRHAVTSLLPTDSGAVQKTTDPTNRHFQILLEERIGESKLKKFKMNTGVWKGAVADESLYYIWLQSATMMGTSADGLTKKKEQDENTDILYSQGGEGESSGREESANSSMHPSATAKRTQNTKKRKLASSSSDDPNQENQIGDEFEDEFDEFGKHIASELRQFPFYNALQCQEKIESVINEERLLVHSRQERQEEIESVLVKQEPGLGEEFCDENTQTRINKESPQFSSYFIKTENISDTESITDEMQ